MKAAFTLAFLISLSSFAAPIRIDVGGYSERSIVLTAVKRKKRILTMIAFLENGYPLRRRVLPESLDRRVREELKEAVAGFPATIDSLGCQRRIRYKATAGKERVACWDTLKAESKDKWENWYAAVLQLR